MREQLALFGGPATVTDPWPPYPVVDYREVNAVTEVVMSRSLSEPHGGTFVTRMEEAYAQYFGTRYALGLSSGTAAIHSALFAVGVQPGDEVLTANHNWISAIMAVFHANAIPVLCDVAPGSFSIDPEEIRRKVTPRTKAIIATHLWGIPTDMDGILRVAAELKLPVLEDVSHAHGGKYKGRYLGTLGDIGCFSLQGSKAIVGGEAGFILTNDERYYQRAMVPGNHPARLREDIVLDDVQPYQAAGGMFMYRIAPVSAAIATAQLEKLPLLNAARQANFARLREEISGVPCITWPALPEGSLRGWYGTPAFYHEEQTGVTRDRFVSACQAEGVNIAGEGYCDWSQIPLLQDMSLLGQMFVTRHANGAAFTAPAPGTLPNNDALRRSMLLFAIPAVESPRLMDQQAAAIRKVAANLDALREEAPAV